MKTQLEYELKQTELLSPVWAVIDYNGVLARDLTYNKAYQIMDENRNRAGITIVSNTVADNLQSRKNANNNNRDTAANADNV